MKVYLDDRKPAPDGWVLTTTPTQTIALLEAGGVTDLSLDHDLADEIAAGTREESTGYDVLLWIEEAIVLRNFVPPERIDVHSDNGGARAKMEAAIRQIRKLYSVASTVEAVEKGRRN